MAGLVSHLEASFLGDTPPLNASSGKPDRRQVSLRWLSGAVLAGLTSTFLMGGALYAALEGRQLLAQPPQLAQGNAGGGQSNEPVARRGARPGVIRAPVDTGSNVLMVSTVTREQDRDIVKVRPFMKIQTALSSAPAADYEYPPFDPLAIYSGKDTNEATSAVSADLIYGADVESEVSLKTIAFDQANARLSKTNRFETQDIELLLRKSPPGTDGQFNAFSGLTQVDPERFSLRETSPFTQTGVTIVAENVTTYPRVDPKAWPGKRFDDRLVRVRAKAPIALILRTEGMDEAEANILQNVLASDLGQDTLQPEDQLRIAFEVTGAGEQIRKRTLRVGVYRGVTHLVSIARTDDDRFVYAQQPQDLPKQEAVTAALSLPDSRLPSAYDAIYRTALSQGVDASLVRKLIRVFSPDIDFSATVNVNDSIAMFVSLDDDKSGPNEKSEILHAAIKLGSTTRKYYRFRDPESGEVDYFDADGKTARKFLLRQPVPNGKFRSPFGSRLHPILRFRKMHWGVDWSAPRGTPIIAAGDGTVEYAEWKSGYGKQTKLRHANGYETSYSHQTAYAKGIVPGARVRQGQVIGFVGTTGLSTGPHLHYEVEVNGAKVDPMRIRLPKGKVLQGAVLAQFQAERDRIDTLMLGEDPTKLAQF